MVVKIVKCSLCEVRPARDGSHLCPACEDGLRLDGHVMADLCPGGCGCRKPDCVCWLADYMEPAR